MVEQTEKMVTFLGSLTQDQDSDSGVRVQQVMRHEPVGTV